MRAKIIRFDWHFPVSVPVPVPVPVLIEIIMNEKYEV